MLDLAANLPDGKPIPLTDLAEYFSVDRRTINSWTRKGLQAAPAGPDGRKLYTDKEAVRAYLMGGQQPEPIQDDQDAQAVRERVRARFGV